MPSANDLLDFSGRRVVVAGAGGGGIGIAVSGFLAGAGANVIGVHNRAEALEDFAAGIRINANLPVFVRDDALRERLTGKHS